jgi:uncharacterized protein (TIGR02391 family)
MCFQILEGRSAMASVPCFDETHLEQICRALGETATGTEISAMLRQINLPDENPAGTKWRRLNDIFGIQQRQDGTGNCVVAFLYKAMNPVRFTNNHEAFEHHRYRLNQVLSFCGYSLEPNGRLRIQKAANTLDEAEERVGKLRNELRRRAVHPDVLRFCRAELVRDNYFHAVLEATKSVADKIRERASLQSDGSALVDEAFALGKSGIPLLAFNSLRTETERGEQSGLMNLMKGMFSAFRNPTAHTPKIFWTITEQDAFDLLTLASLLHRRIDSAISTPRVTGP